MSARKQIINCGSNEYLSQVDDFKDGLPKNCLFNKGKTGVGGTTLALNDSYPTVICFPFKSVIENKVQQSKSNPGSFKYELIPYYSGCPREDFRKALARNPTAKILTTYDSLNCMNDFINPSEFNLVVDEYQCLLTEYSYRQKACDTVYSQFHKYKNYTFLSATPIPKKFLTNDICHLKEVEAIWENKEQVNIHPISTTSVIKTLCHHINRLFNGEIEGNLYIFVNSINIGNSVIRNCNLTNDNTRFIFSESNDAQIANGISRGNSTNQPKRINIITKTGFLGCDFYDEQGKIIIVSDGNKDHTYVDVEMSLPQIIGRIRNSKFKNDIYHIHGIRSLDYDYQMSYEQYEKTIDSQTEKAYEIIRKYHSDYDQTHKNQLHSCVKNNQSGDSYYDFMVFNEMGIPIVNDRLTSIAKFNYYVKHSTYQNINTLTKSYNPLLFKQNDIIFHTPEFEIIPLGEFRGIVAANNCATELLLKNKEFGELSYEETQRLQSCFLQFPILKEAYEMFGFEEFIGLKVLNKSNLTKRVATEKIKLSKLNSSERIATYLMQTGLIRIGKHYSTAEINTALGIAYSELGYHLTIKSTDIKNYFNVQEFNKRLEGRERSRGWCIISKKFEYRLAG